MENDMPAWMLTCGAEDSGAGRGVTLDVAIGRAACGVFSGLTCVDITCSELTNLYCLTTTCYFYKTIWNLQ